MVQILQGDCLDVLRTLPDESVHCVVTSPPYWGLRDYGVEGQLGLEKTPEEYVAKMVEVFREVRRVLRADGTAWVNMGDSYCSQGGLHDGRDDNQPGVGAKELWRNGTRRADGVIDEEGRRNRNGVFAKGLKPKDLCGIPWRLAFALQADGWFLRQDIIWCLSGGTWLYVKTQTSGVCLMTVKDMARLKPQWVQLWNGKEWVYLAGMSKSKRKGDELELVLRSGERISCTPAHKFPTDRGLLEASAIRAGDSLARCRLPSPYPVESNFLGHDAAWFAGLYLAEGSRSKDKIQIAGHSKEADRWTKVQEFARHYGGTATRTIDGNNMSIRVYGKIPNAIVDELITGRTAHDKGFSPTVWRHDDNFIEAMVMGYLGGDGHWDFQNRRWRLGFCRNYNLERDLRTACARLGWTLTLNLSSVQYNGKRVPTFRGELRVDQSGHFNCRNRDEVVEIRKARCREVYDIGVHGDPHLFALASGILTHNSKPNPMPESVTDRCTKAHEYIFLLTKAARYFYDAEAIKENGVIPAGTLAAKGSVERFNTPGVNSRPPEYKEYSGTRNKRSVWTVPSAPYSEAHFATFPPDLIKPCILAGTSARGCCPKCGAPWERMVETSGGTWAERKANGQPMRYGIEGVELLSKTRVGESTTKTTGWQPTCECGESAVQPCTVLDPFGGSGTTGMVALELGRKAVLIELNPEYVRLANKRTHVTPGLQIA